VKSGSREQTLQIAEVALAGIEQPGPFVSVAETAFAEELAIRYPDGSMEERWPSLPVRVRMASAAPLPSALADRIRNRHEAKFFDVIAGKQAESRCIGNVSRPNEGRFGTRTSST